MSKIPEDTEKRVSPEFQQRLKDLISDEECTKKEFASAVGISKDVIIRATLYGIIPSLQSLIKIADHLDISLDYLLAETDDRSFYKSENPTTFHTRLEYLKNEKNTKYSKISHSMPFSRNSFNEWLSRKTFPSLEYLKAIAEYFDVSIDYLLGRTDYRHN